jgi:uncharacterized membrane protein
VLYLIHPATVHFAVALLVAGASAEAWGLARGRDTLATWGSRAMLAGSAAAVVSVAAGYLAANTAPIPPDALVLLDWHERSGLALLALLVAALVWKAWNGGTVPSSQRAAYVALLVAIVALVATSAWLGGRLVYVEGVGVGPLD